LVLKFSETHMTIIQFYFLVDDTYVRVTALRRKCKFNCVLHIV